MEESVSASKVTGIRNGKWLPESKVFLFAMGTFTAAIFFSLVNSYSNYYATDIALVDPGIYGTVNLIVRLLLVVATPIFGILVQNGRSRFGKYRGWIFRTMPIVSICALLSFTKLSGSAVILALFYSIANALASGLIGISGNAQLSLMTVMSKEESDYRRLSTRRSQLQDVAKILFSLGFLPLVALIGGSPQSETGFFWTAAIIAVLIFIGYMGTAWAGKDYDVYENASGAREKRKPLYALTGKEMLDAVVKNSPLIVLLVTETLKFTAFMIFISTMAYYFQYILKDFSAITPILTVASISSVLSSLLAPLVMKQIGRKGAYTMALAFHLAGVLIPRMLPPNAIIFGIGFVLIYFGMSLATCSAPIMFAESGDYLEHKTGRNARGFIMSLFVFPVQIGIAVSGGAVNWILDGMGYVPGAELTAKQLASMQNLVLLIPGVMFLAGTIISILYPLMAEQVTKIRAELAAKPASSV
ncbi:MAG: MFS transporter [Anaerolineales bacterium]|nr:MFS transporter [Anaerolineales bacterium]